jgi:hypothetical protein
MMSPFWYVLEAASPKFWNNFLHVACNYHYLWMGSLMDIFEASFFGKISVLC